MASSPILEPELEAPVPQHWDETPGRRKMDRKIVVKVRTEENSEKQKTDSPPSDFWSWRKYGQKPIKGSPYPRGYFRCSTSKGCSAKKQVERCRTDASLLIITYTSNHNHPGPDLLHLFSTTEHVQKGDLPVEEPPTTTCEEDKSTSEEHPHPQSPPKCTEESSQVEEQDEEEKSNRRQDDIHFGGGGAHPVPKRSTEENNDFFDELEELPMSSSCTSILSSFFDERVLLLPS